jgi:hypothetical protein
MVSRMILLNSSQTTDSTFARFHPVPLPTSTTLPPPLKVAAPIKTSPQHPIIDRSMPVLDPYVSGNHDCN